jgi:predicted PurR-regulated permease PerM
VQPNDRWLSFALRLSFALLFLWVVGSEIIPIALAALFTLLLDPVRQRLVRRGGFLAKHAPLLLTGAIIFGVVLPVVALAAQVVASINELLSVGLSEILDKVQAFLATHFSGIADALHLPVESLRDGALSLAKRLGSGLAAWAGDLASALPGQFVDTFLFLIAVYYFLRDGTALVAWLMRLSPFQAHDTDELFASIRETVAGSIVGQLATSLVQGGLTLIALWLFNVPGALVFGLVATLLSILPMVGTTPITLGAVLYLLASGRNGAAIGMAVAALIIGTSDNIVRPWVQSSQTKMHPLITLLAIFGGISALGLAGVFLGPVIAAMAIWTFEFSAKLRRREASPPPASA